MKKKNRNENMLMCLNVGLVRSTSMFMYEWNLKIWKKKKQKKNIVRVLCSGSGAVGLSRMENHDLNWWNSDEYK